MSPRLNLTLPAERYEQLKRLADRHGITITALVERLINEKIAAGELADELPGFTVEVARHRRPAIRVDLGGFGLPLVAADDAVALASALDEVAERPTPGGKHFAPARGPSLKAARVGKGVVVVGCDEAGLEIGRRAITVAMAHDLARQVRRAAQLAIAA